MTFFREIMVKEKNNFPSNAYHNFAKGKIISKSKNDKPLKNYIGQVLAPPPLSFRKTCPCTILPLPFLIFQIYWKACYKILESIKISGNMGTKWVNLKRIILT